MRRGRDGCHAKVNQPCALPTPSNQSLAIEIRTLGFVRRWGRTEANGVFCVKNSKKAVAARLAPNDQSRPEFGGNMRKSAELFLARMGVTLALAFLASFVLLVR